MILFSCITLYLCTFFRCTKLHKPKFVSFLNLNHEKCFKEYSGRKLEEDGEEKEEEEEEKKAISK